MLKLSINGILQLSRKVSSSSCRVASIILLLHRRSYRQPVTACRPARSPAKPMAHDWPRKVAVLQQIRSHMSPASDADDAKKCHLHHFKNASSGRDNSANASESYQYSLTPAETIPDSIEIRQERDSLCYHRVRQPPPALDSYRWICCLDKIMLQEIERCNAHQPGATKARMCRQQASAKIKLATPARSRPARPRRFQKCRKANSHAQQRAVVSQSSGYESHDRPASRRRS